MADELCERIDLIRPNFSKALIIGACGKRIQNSLNERGISSILCHHGQPRGVALVCDEDRIPFADHCFDLIICCGTLDSVNDVPGALILMRRILRPGGLFLGALSGAGALPMLRKSLTEAEMANGRGVGVHIHPQIDVRAAGDLLSRAGFFLPVADQDIITAKYSSLGRLVSDLRAMGMNNAMRTPAPFMKETISLAKSLFMENADTTGRVHEIFAPLYLTGWAPEIGETRPSGPVKASSAGIKGVSAGGISKL